MRLTGRVYRDTNLDSLALKSYAKVNLTLDVYLRRPDGYHDIRSIMQAIDLHDVVTIRKAPPGVIEVSVDSPIIPSGPGNLAYKAAVLLKEVSRPDPGVYIDIQKNIPIQAGLGGGSSNAAATLIGMNKLLGLQLEQNQLLELAAELGSDVPFFITGGTMLAEGRGERLTELNDAPELIFVVVKPDVGVSTAKAYAALDAVEDRVPGQATEHMLEALDSGRPNLISESVSNDFELAVLPEHPIIQEIRDSLIFEGAGASLLCGSGAAVFGIFNDETKAEKAAESLHSLGQTYVTLSITKTEAQDPWL